jgi:hypothetical protein
MKNIVRTFLRGSILTQTSWQTEMPDARGRVKKDFNCRKTHQWVEMNFFWLNWRFADNSGKNS